jgi:Golgi apparatus protein 1
MNEFQFFRLVCSENYFGPHCDDFCRPRDDQFGHYSCADDGSKVCIDGFRKDPSNPDDEYCTKGELRKARKTF